MDAFALDFRQNKKKKTIIVCEGSSDVAFISLYLERELGFEFDRKATGVPRLNDGKTHLYRYFNNAFDLSIYSAGGCERIKHVFEKIVRTELMFKEYDNINIIVIIDADENTNSEQIKKIENNLFLFKYGEQFDGVYKNSSGVSLKYHSFFYIVPKDENGAFENVLIKSLIKDEKEISESVLHFYENMDDKTRKYIKKKRLFIKSELNCILNIINPTKMFEELSSLFNNIDTSSEIIKNNYGFLDQILGNNND